MKFNIIFFLLRTLLAWNPITKTPNQATTFKSHQPRWDDIESYDTTQWHIAFGAKTGKISGKQLNIIVDSTQITVRTRKKIYYNCIGYAIGLEDFVARSAFVSGNYSIMKFDEINNEATLYQRWKEVSSVYKTWKNLNDKGIIKEDERKYLLKFSPNPKALLNVALTNSFSENNFFNWGDEGLNLIRRKCASDSEVVLFYFQIKNGVNKLVHGSRRYNGNFLPDKLIIRLKDNVFVSKMGKSFWVAHQFEWRHYGPPKIAWCSDLK